MDIPLGSTTWGTWVFKMYILKLNTLNTIPKWEYQIWQLLPNIGGKGDQKLALGVTGYV